MSHQQLSPLRSPSQTSLPFLESPPLLPHAGPLISHLDDREWLPTWLPISDGMCLCTMLLAIILEFLEHSSEVTPLLHKHWCPCYLQSPDFLVSYGAIQGLTQAHPLLRSQPMAHAAGREDLGAISGSVLHSGCFPCPLCPPCSRCSSCRLWPC